MTTETRLSVVRMCEVAGFSRAGYYRFLEPEKPAPAEMDLRDEIRRSPWNGPATEADGWPRN